MKKILIVITTFVLLFMLNGCGKKEETGGTTPGDKVESGYSEQIIEGLKINNINLLLENGSTTVVGTLENTNNKKTYVKYIEVMFYDASNKELASSLFYLDENLEVGEVYQLQTGVSSDITSAKNIKFKVIK